MPRAFRALRIAEVVEARQHRPDAAPHVERYRGGGERAVGRAMVGRLEGYYAAAPRVLARELYRAVYRVGAGEAVCGLLRKIAGRYLRELLGKLDGRFLVHVADGVAEQTLRLLLYRGDYPRMAGARVERGRARREVNIFVAVGVAQSRAGAGRDGEGVVGRARRRRYEPLVARHDIKRFAYVSHLCGPPFPLLKERTKLFSQRLRPRLLRYVFFIAPRKRRSVG